MGTPSVFWKVSEHCVFSRTAFTPWSHTIIRKIEALIHFDISSNIVVFTDTLLESAGTPFRFVCLQTDAK